MALQSISKEKKSVEKGYLGLANPNFKESVSTFFAQISKNWILLKRYPIGFFASFGNVFVILLIFIFSATLFSSQNGDGIETSAIAGLMTYGLMFILFTEQAWWTIGGSLRQEQYQGTLESLFLTPSNKFTDLISRISIITIYSTIYSIAGVIIITLIIGRLPFYNFTEGLVAFILTLSGAFGIGFFMAGIGIKLKESTEILANLLQFFTMVLCAMFFPFKALPEPMLWVSRLIPLSYGVDLTRSIMMDYPSGFPELLPVSLEWVIVGSFGVLMPIIGFLFFRWTIYRQRLKSGLSDY